MFLLLACRPEPAEAPPAGTALAVVGEALVLAHGGEERLALPFSGIEIGVADQWEEGRSYDPFFPLDLGSEAGNVRWTKVQSASGSGPVSLTLSDGTTATLTWSMGGEGRYTLHLDSAAPVVAAFRLTFRVDAEEGFYGLGSALDTPNRRGSVRAVQLEVDPTTEAFSNEMHVHVPFVVGTTGWGLLVRHDHPQTFAFGAEPGAADEMTVTVGTGPDSPAGLSFEWYAADHPLDVTARYWQSTGIHRLPARWALGPWHWRDENVDQAEVEADLRTLRELDLATTGVWIDRPYATGVNTFDFEAARFPDPQAMIGLAHELGFRMALWHTPYVAPEEAVALNAEATASGYFPPVAPPAFIDWGTPIDYSNPEAFAWWQGLIRGYEAMGIEGYKLDYAEEVLLGLNGGRLPWLFHDGTDERTKHADYQRLYHQVYAETLPAEGGFLLVRTGAFGDQVHGPIVWPGDLDATLSRWGEPMVDREGEAYVSVGGLAASLVDGLSLGPSGFPFYGSDTGGYRHSPPDNETFVRWYQQTALSSVMQVGNSTNDVVWEPDEINGFDEQTLAGFREFARLHLRLWPYLWTYAEQIGRGEGRPIQRALGLAHPELGVHPGDTYLLGDALLVAPVVDRGVREREVVFPAGEWIDWFDGEILGSGAHTVSAELHELPLYLRAGGLVPLLRPTIDTLAPTPSPDVDSYDTTPGVLWWRVFAGGGEATEFALFDGARLTQQVDEDEVVLGWTDGTELVEGAMVELIGEPEPVEVLLDGQILDPVDDPAAGGFSWSPAVGGTLTVRIPPGASEVRICR